MVGREYPGEGAILLIYGRAYFIEYKWNKPKKIKKRWQNVFSEHNQKKIKFGFTFCSNLWRESGDWVALQNITGGPLKYKGL